MLLLSRAVHVYVATEPCCLRKSFEGLANEVRQALLAKRLERGTFTFPARVTSGAVSVEVDVHELSMLLEGIDVTRARTSRRWEPPANAAR